MVVGQGVEILRALGFDLGRILSDDDFKGEQPVSTQPRVRTRKNGGQGVEAAGDQPSPTEDAPDR
jgi:hypothetical protein